MTSVLTVLQLLFSTVYIYLMVVTVILKTDLLLKSISLSGMAIITILFMMDML